MKKDMEILRKGFWWVFGKVVINMNLGKKNGRV